MNKSTFAFEFKNGVYFSNDKSGKLDNKTKRFIERDSPEFAALDMSKTTNKHLETNFDHGDYSNWSQIETPFLDKILDLQEFSDDIKKWIYVMLGRLFYPMGLHDNWSLIVFLYGVSRSGKSELLKIIVDIIGNAHVNTNSAESDTKLLAIDGSLNLEAMIAGIRSTIPWESSMIMTSSHNPFPKNEHAITHVFPVNFEYTYKDEDVDLEKGLVGEKGKILRKINEAYLESLPEYSELKDLKSVLPEFFK